MNIYRNSSYEISELITRKYSTSFYFASLFYKKEIREAIYSIYGFVRFADEIVDTFHDYDKEGLLNKFEADLSDAFNRKISLNPVLNSFQLTVEKYQINHDHIKAFLRSMRMDLTKQTYKTNAEIKKYIYGSAEVVGLMCLKVFCEGNDDIYRKLETPAIKLGAAFQKVNFLRDLRNDTENLRRKYFPEVDEANFSEKVKNEIIHDIEEDFKIAFKGIRQLVPGVRLAVLTAYYYYSCLLNKIRKTPADKIFKKRIRISNAKKLMLIFKAYIFHISCFFEKDE